MVVMMMMTTVQSSSSVSPLSSDRIPPWTPPMPSLQASLHHPEIIIETIIVIVAIIKIITITVIIISILITVLMMITITIFITIIDISPTLLIPTSSPWG